jgi:hypothetical protein
MKTNLAIAQPCLGANALSIDFVCAEKSTQRTQSAGKTSVVEQSRWSFAAQRAARGSR